MRPRNSCQDKCCQISCTQEQIKPVKENLFVIQTRELVKKLVKETCSSVFTSCFGRQNALENMSYCVLYCSVLF